MSSAGTVSLRASRALLSVLNGNDLALARWTGELGSGKPPEGWGLGLAPVALSITESDDADGLWDVWENSAAKAGAKKGASDAAADADPVADAPEPAPAPAAPDYAALHAVFVAALKAAGIDGLAEGIALCGLAVGAGQMSPAEAAAKIAEGLAHVGPVAPVADAPVADAPVDVVGVPMSLPA